MIDCRIIGPCDLFGHKNFLLFLFFFFFVLLVCFVLFLFFFFLSFFLFKGIVCPESFPTKVYGLNTARRGGWGGGGGRANE